MTLHGYNLQYNETNKATLTLLWQAQHPLGVDYGITIRLVDENGLQWQDDSPKSRATGVLTGHRSMVA